MFTQRIKLWLFIFEIFQNLFVTLNHETNLSFKHLLQLADNFCTNFINFLLINQCHERQFVICQSKVPFFKIEFPTNLRELVEHLIYYFVRLFVGFSHFLRYLSLMFFDNIQNAIELDVMALIVCLCTLAARAPIHESGDLAFWIDANRESCNFIRTFEFLFLCFECEQLRVYKSVFLSYKQFVVVFLLIDLR